MSESETALLRKELAKVVAENRDWQMRVARFEAAFAKREEMLEAEIDRLRLEIAERDRRLARYENPNAPSSTDSLYNEERAAFWKRMEKEGEPGPEGGSEPEDGDSGGMSRRGLPKGHAGKSHGNRAERTVTLLVSRCGECGRGHLKQLSSVTRLACDFPDDRVMRIECVAYVIGRAFCKRCGEISAARAPVIPGTCFGLHALGFVEEYYAKRATDETTSYFFKALYGFAVSPNTVWNARKALKNLLKGTYGEILNHIAEATFVQFDESVFKMNGRKGYVWLVTVEDATYLVAAPSRAAAVLDLHFGKLPGIPVVSDGYAVHDIFPVRQRCWAHILREAEKMAIRNGGNDLSCYRRLLSLYKRIKGRESAGSAECLDLERAVLQIAVSYGKGHRFRGTLEGAAPHRFTFLRYPGMSPHNNAAELEIRDSVVLHRNVRHQLSEPEGRAVFSVLVSVARTCYRRGIFPRMAVEELARDPDWSIFKPPEQERKEPAMLAAAAC